MGIRASAPLAFHAADPAGADALWLWLPVVDGCAHVQSLEAQDLAARTDPHRYPLRALPVPAEREELVGFRTSAGFRRELASRSGERRVGTAGVSKCSSRCAPFHTKKNN